MDSSAIGNRIKQYRTKKGISQEKLGQCVFVSSKYISYLETGSKTPSLELLILIANALDVSADDLLTDNLARKRSQVEDDIHTLLMDCNHDEREMLLRLLRFTKALFLEFNI